MQVIENGNGIVTTRTFLGSVTRVGVLLSGDVGRAGGHGRAPRRPRWLPGASVQVTPAAG